MATSTVNTLRSSSSSSAAGGGNISVRRLFSSTVILQDWDRDDQLTTTGNCSNVQHQNTDDHSESTGSSSYWELFIDLLLVAAASSIADTFKESRDVSQFILSYMIIINGWFLYSYHLATRFENSSFGASMLLFVYLVGFGWSIANIRDFSKFTNVEDNNNNNDNDAVQEFIYGATILRVSILLMLGGISISIPRARYFCTVMTIILFSSMIGFFLAFVGTTQRNVKIIQVGLWIAALTEFLSENIASRFIDIKKFIPVNIEQSQERFNALGLVMLGETVVSITQTFRELVIQTEEEDSITSVDATGTTSTAYVVKTQYYFVLILSLLLIFMMTLNLFHTSPPVAEHALRRSKAHAVTLMIIQKSIGILLLAVGVSVKLIVEAVMKQEELSKFGYRCMSFGVGAALILNFFIRLLHHAGKRELRFGNHIHVFGTNRDMDRVAMIWWFSIAILSFLPFIWYMFGKTTHDPITATMYHAGLVFGLCFAESTYTHILLDMIPSSSSSIAGENCSDASGVCGEQQPLL